MAFQVQLMRTSLGQITLARGSERPHTAEQHRRLLDCTLSRRPLQRPGAKRNRPGVYAGVARSPTPSEGRSRSFSNGSFSHRRPRGWLKPAKAGSAICLSAHSALKRVSQKPWEIWKG